MGTLAVVSLLMDGLLVDLPMIAGAIFLRPSSHLLSKFLIYSVHGIAGEEIKCIRAGYWKCGLEISGEDSGTCHVTQEPANIP